jgi:hypothetical protein
VLTEYYMDEQRKADLATASLRAEAGFAAEMVAAEEDVRSEGSDPLLESALDHRIHVSCRRVLTLLESFSYDPELLRGAMQPLRVGSADLRRERFHSLLHALTPEHRQLLSPLLERATRTSRGVNGPETQYGRRREERIIDLALSRYQWVTPWVRACALRALGPSSPAAMAALVRAAADGHPLVSETATATLSGTEGHRHRTIDKVVLLKGVSLFAAIPHESLAQVAPLLSERWADPGELVVSKGEDGDCLYLIASGSVRVHDGDRVLGDLRPLQYFGEMSLLDGKPRSADVTALEPSQLFRLDHEDFYRLTTEHAEIAHAINRALCDQVRSMLAADA